MERSEPTLVPEWLKGTGSVSGGGSTTHHSASSSLHSDDRAATLSTRNRSSVGIGDCDSPRSAFSDRISSSYFRRSSSSNGSVVHDKELSAHTRSYSNFGRSHRDRDWDKDLLDFREKERSVRGDYWDRDYSDLPGISANVFTSRIDKDTLRRSQSMISGKRGEVWPRRVAVDSNSVNNNHSNNNGVVGSNISSIHKATFERDFPSLGAEERPGVPDIGRVSSPGLSSALQSLPLGSSSVIGGNGWTSALAEVPVIIGSNSTVLSSVQQTAPASSSALASNMPSGLNMAEKLVQTPSRARTAPQLSVETQRLEELAIKQSRQLIPMTPSMPKTSVLSSEKQKPKTGARNEASIANMVGQQQLSSPHLVNHALRGGQAKSDVGKTSHGGKLLVLKSARENGISPINNDSLNPSNVGRIANDPLAVASSAAFVPVRSSNNPKLAATERKTSTLPATLAISMEKKPTMSQAQSRNDFFNLMRKKTSISSAAPDPNTVVPSSVLKKSNETESTTAPVSPQGSDAPMSDPSSLDWSTENGGVFTGNGIANGVEESQRIPNDGEKHLSPDAILYPDEEEAAFLRSLGWDENAGEEEGLTEEEINSFYEYMKLRPSSKLCQGMRQQKLSRLLDSQAGSVGGASSGLSLSDSKANA